MAEPRIIQHGEQIRLTAEIAVTKDLSVATSNNPNMWYIHIRRPEDGVWENVQWMDVGHMERLLNLKLPRYRATPSGKLKPIKS